ncbi:MAG: histidinol-phosphatase [Bacillota bacterium]|nr:histidinol-phosphatase [Bacillota bacterium]
MIKSNFHTHTSYCDGQSTAEEMVKEAIKENFTALGFSGHSYTSFDESYAMSLANEQKYKDEIANLKGKYKSKIMIFCGLELDFFSDYEALGYDYIIGSVHYVKKDGVVVPVDLSPESLKDNVNNLWGGDWFNFTEDYYNLVSLLQAKTKADIYGHIDLVLKFNEANRFFDQTDKRYVNQVLEAVDSLLEADKIFEVNTGAMANGLRTIPYPEKWILKYINSKGGKVMLSSDCHNAQKLAYGFDSAAEILKDCGFKEVYTLNQSGFEPVKL